MNLICPVCSVPIAPADANIAEGVCTCRQCGGFFKISSLLTDDAVATRVSKPAYSAVQLVMEPDSVGLVIPSGNNRGSSWFVLCFAIVWNAISWSIFLVSLLGGPLPLILFSLIFASLGVFLGLVAAYAFFGEFSLVADRTDCRAVWTLFGLKYRRRIASGSITAVTEEVVYTKNYQPVYGVGLKHGSGKTLKFGSTLTEEERKWAIGEFRHFFRVGG